MELLEGVFGVAATIGSLATAASLVYLARQTNVANTLARAGAHDRLTDLALMGDAIFVEHPELRKYFYNSARIYDLSAVERARVFAMAEFLCDFMENALQHESYRGSRVSGAWLDWCRQLMRDSIAIREYLHLNRAWYDKDIICLLDEVEEDRKKVLLARADDLVVEELSSTSAAGIVSALALIYDVSFPAYEKVDADLLFKRREADRCILFAKRGDHVVGFACILPIKGSSINVHLLEYLAVQPESRSGGCGSILLQNVIDYVTKAGSRTLFLELEDPEVPTGSGDAARRIAFYERNGCHKVPWIGSYMMPDFTVPTNRIAMKLYYHGLGRLQANYDKVETLRAMYRTAYGKRGAPLLDEILASISEDALEE